jgi:hypothetical protein
VLSPVVSSVTVIVPTMVRTAIRVPVFSVFGRLFGVGIFPVLGFGFGFVIMPSVAAIIPIILTIPIIPAVIPVIPIIPAVIPVMAPVSHLNNRISGFMIHELDRIQRAGHIGPNSFRIVVVKSPGLDLIRPDNGQKGGQRQAKARPKNFPAVGH